MEQMAYFLKRTPPVEPFKELTEQKDNNFTLLDLLDPVCVAAVCATQNYIFTLNSDTFDLKCWSSRSSKLQNSTRLKYTPKNGDQYLLLVNTTSVALVVSGNNASRIFLWDFRRKDIQHLEEAKIPKVYRNKIMNAVVNDNMLVTFSSDNEITFWNLKGAEILPDYGSVRKPITFMELSNDCVNGSLYLAHSKTLSIVHDFTNFEQILWRDVDAIDKVVALHVVKPTSIEVILTGHKNPFVRIWRNDLILIKAVNLLDISDSPKQQLNTQCTYRIHYISERDELIISHNENITIYKMISGTVVHQEQQAHRYEITEITSYKGDPSYLITVCASAIRLWRYTQASEPGMNLVGEITVSNVDKVIPVSDVGLYLAGKCYYAGLVLWRHANSYLTRQLKTSRKFS